MDNLSSSFIIDGDPYHIEVGGMYNIYNALAGCAVAEYYGVPPEKIRLGLAYDEKIFGRQETFKIKNKSCTLILVKNPVGLNQVIDMITLAPQPFALVSLLNANYADGIDISWIWDGNYEALAALDIPEVIAGGERHDDMVLRLKVAGLDEARIQEIASLTEVIKTIENLDSDSIYILATYTAVLSLRKELAARGYIGGGMEHGN